ncbi:unnamed protein product [Linum trigynum]|uniref:Uncharacterized protein n=1 Tax=Linum trigynum TaxID=586398 RepID=A0AAV2DR25_9ROSI
MTDSEASHSSDSLSLPSEPPDLRNWFSGYQYDSFVLDTYDDAFRSRGQEDPSIVDVAEKIRANDDGNLSEHLETGDCGDGSEAPESSYSPAFLNEPNHPENWVSSYVSDSGGLDHDGELETPAIWESQGNEGAFIEEGINREPHFENSEEKTLEKPPSSDEVIANEFLYREGNEDRPLGSEPSCSPPFLNEPEHPENWISSYVSDSGGLVPDDEPESAAVWETQGSEDGFIKERNETLEKLPLSDEYFVNDCKLGEANEDIPLTMDPLSQSPSALLSEPPDIRNWFSSYAYESPAPGEESNRFAESELQHTDDVIINGEGNRVEEMKSQCIDMDQGNIDREFKLDARLHCNSSSRNNNHSHLLHSAMSIPKAMKSLETYKIHNSNKKSPTKLTPGLDAHSFEESKAAESDESNAKLIAESNDGSNITDQEAKNAASSASGFVATRKKNRITRLNYDENSCQGSRIVAPKGFKSERRKNFSSSYDNAAKDDSSGNRKALSERSPNVVQHSEITGKWKCPQRSKPVMGPPLKQLRLEKWVTRL